MRFFIRNLIQTIFNKVILRGKSNNKFECVVIFKKLKENLKENSGNFKSFLFRQNFQAELSLRFAARLCFPPFWPSVLQLMAAICRKSCGKLCQLTITTLWAEKSALEFILYNNSKQQQILPTVFYSKLKKIFPLFFWKWNIWRKIGKMTENWEN